MISTIDFSSGGEDYQPDSIASVVRGTVAVYPVFDEDRFIYVLRHTFTGFIFCEAGTRDAALKELRQLYALDSWYVQSSKKLPADIIAKGLYITTEADKSVLLYEDKP
ncbi:hypothetical protein [Microseira wollei]|uniref:Uncharacterized protein n=1 Tax=Microseira wollei NIES-4236 TaxID=2530354 RepID=A0AAV3XSJ6_9CYAN|nr:hypothetical protein [Microseira wollei]GET44370.1 hypothetical protein MiSe_91970 [Microseira wollei NIES-4236]